MTRAKRVGAGAAIGAGVGILANHFIYGDEWRFAGPSIGNVFGELIGILLAWALIGALIAFFVRPRLKATSLKEREQDTWSDQEKETFRNLINKRD
jgi:hypothetical protein